VALLVEDLWSQIFRGAAEREGLCATFEDFGQPEVSEADIAVFVH
jgi:hypothetical protein